DQQIGRLRARLTAEPETVPLRTHQPNPARLPLQTKLGEMEAELQGYQAAHNAALAQFNAKKAVLDDMGPWEVTLARLTSDRDTARSAYNSLSEQSRDLEIRSKARIRTARVMERANVPVSPVRPRKTTSIAFSAILALLLA